MFISHKPSPKYFIMLACKKKFNIVCVIVFLMIVGLIFTMAIMGNISLGRITLLQLTSASTLGGTVTFAIRTIINCSIN